MATAVEGCLSKLVVGGDLHTQVYVQVNAYATITVSCVSLSQSLSTRGGVTRWTNLKASLVGPFEDGLMSFRRAASLLEGMPLGCIVLSLCTRMQVRAF